MSFKEALLEDTSGGPGGKIVGLGIIGFLIYCFSLYLYHHPGMVILLIIVMAGIGFKIAPRLWHHWGATVE